MALQQQQARRVQMQMMVNQHQLLEAASAQCFKSCVTRMDSDALTPYQSDCVKSCVDKFFACQQTMQAMLSDMAKQHETKRSEHS